MQSISGSNRVPVWSYREIRVESVCSAGVHVHNGLAQFLTKMNIKEINLSRAPILKHQSVLDIN